MRDTSLKYEKLLRLLSGAGGAVVAFSGGVDSTLLLHAAREALGSRVLAATVSTPYIPQWEIREAKAFARSLGIVHIIPDVPFSEELRMNPPDHCYTCKKILFGKLREVAGEHNVPRVLDGTNIDDLDDYRPGLKALRELGVMSPLMDAGLAKPEIRELSRELGLPTWDKPSFACLMSRMPVNVRVTEEALNRVEKAEVFLMESGFPAVRVRHHGEIARIEVPRGQIPDLVRANVFPGIDTRLRALGYRHVTVDLGGYEMGSQNPSSAQLKG